MKKPDVSRTARPIQMPSATSPTEYAASRMRRMVTAGANQRMSAAAG
jgi:hypothetical protein